jgi:hypothetical protein
MHIKISYLDHAAYVIQIVPEEYTAEHNAFRRELGLGDLTYDPILAKVYICTMLYAKIANASRCVDLIYTYTEGIRVETHVCM